MDIVSLTEGLAQLPMPYLVVGATVLLMVTAVVLRVLSNTLTFKAPPVMEGIPFVGGLIKFSKVRRPHDGMGGMWEPAGREKAQAINAQTAANAPAGPPEADDGGV